MSIKERGIKFIVLGVGGTDVDFTVNEDKTILIGSGCTGKSMLVDNEITSKHNRDILVTPSQKNRIMDTYNKHYLIENEYLDLYISCDEDRSKDDHFFDEDKNKHWKPKKQNFIKEKTGNTPSNKVRQKNKLKRKKRCKKVRN